MTAPKRAKGHYSSTQRNEEARKQREMRLIAVAELMPRRLTFRAMAAALEAEYPAITPVTHTTVARDVNILIERFKIESSTLANKTLMADLATLDDDEQMINKIIVGMASVLLPENKTTLPDNFAIDRFVKLLERKRRILEHRNKLLGLESVAENLPDGANAGLRGAGDSEQSGIDRIMALLDAARARRDHTSNPKLQN